MLRERVLFANFFARVKKLVVDYLLTLSFNLVTLDFANNKKLLKTTTTIFLKSFFILIDLSIVATTREIRRIIDNKAKIERNVNYTNILKASRLHAN
jgi:hypothetical protein